MRLIRITYRKAAPSARLAHPSRDRWYRTAAGWVMAWGRIDDEFDDHPKVLALLEDEQGGAAIGLWTLCFTWAHRNTRKKGRTPGLIPVSLPRRFLGPGARELAILLVKVGLWEDRADEGWLFHDFDRYLPTEQTREARAEAGKRGAEARWGKRAGRDSKLPSSDGNGMAADGSDGASGTERDAIDPKGAQRPRVDGKEPSSDSNLPSGLPVTDGKPMASDGSRAPARWAISNEIAPTPAPIVPATPDAPKPRRRSKPEDPERAKNAGDIVAAFVDGALASGQDEPPTSIKARVGRDARQLFGSGQGRRGANGVRPPDGHGRVERPSHPGTQGRCRRRCRQRARAARPRNQPALSAPGSHRCRPARPGNDRRKGRT